MGSPKVHNVQPTTPMADEKKSIKNLLKKPFQALFNKNKKKEKPKEIDVIVKEDFKPVKSVNVTPVTDVIEKIKKLELDKKVCDSEDEFSNFTYKLIKNEIREKRNDSHSSEDSGFVEKCMASANDECKDKVLVDSFKKLTVEVQDKNEQGKKPKKLQTVVIDRGGPIGTQRKHGKSVHPYQEADDSLFRQIHQVNRYTFSGGQVIVNTKSRPSDNCTDIETALKLVDMNVTEFGQNTQQEQVDRWQIAQEFVNEERDKSDNILSHLIKESDRISTTNYSQNKPPPPNPIEECSTTTHTYDYDIDLTMINRESEKPSIFLTPPRSENVLSPMSDSQASFYPTADYTLSPETTSSMCNSDYEKFQYITPIDEYPTCLVENAESDKDTHKTKEKCSMTMKQFKDLQKQIAMDFSKKECCQSNKNTCRNVFDDHIKKLAIEERRSLCFQIANLDLKTACGMLHHILFNLSNDQNEHFNTVIFILICEKLLKSEPFLFVGDLGLSILKLAVMRCNHKPLITRCIMQYIRSVTRSDAYKPTAEHVFSEVDALGDNLVIACARAGDEFSDVLSEIVRDDDSDIPLFNVHHCNIDGYTALHVCCVEHEASAPRAHTLHVLLRHARADLWRGDIKGGDTPLHLAVNSANCDLNMIMILFQHVDRKEWRKLAHFENRSSVNPLEYARSAVKSTTRQNYPVQVLDFLKKCR